MRKRIVLIFVGCRSRSRNSNQNKASIGHNKARHIRQVMDEVLKELINLTKLLVER